MPGHYADELRRITREQGGAPEPSGPASDASDGSTATRRRARSLLVVLAVLSVAAIGLVVIRQLMADAQLQDCVMSGRKNCAPLEIDPTGR